MAQLARQPYSFEEYVELEEFGTIKHEFLDGEVWAMTGGSPEHAAIAATVVGLLQQALPRRPCQVFTSDLRIRVKETGLATYPDVSVICNAIELDPEDRKGHTAINPTLLVEVPSPSTERYDRGEKLAHYKQVPTLSEVMFVAQDKRCVDLCRRTEQSWTQLTFGPGQEVVLESLHGVTLSVDDVYFDPLAT